MRAAIDRAAEEIVEEGGRVSIIWCHPHEKVSFDLQQDKNVRYMNSFVDVAVGVQTNAVNTLFGPLPLAVVPGDSIGTYTNSGTRRDMYLLDESTHHACRTSVPKDRPCSRSRSVSRVS